MQDGRAQLPAIPQAVLEPPAPGTEGPALADWRIVELALAGSEGEEGWVVLRVDPFEVLPLCEDAITARGLAKMRAGTISKVWTWNEGRWFE